jgi:hypothetical protein
VIILEPHSTHRWNGWRPSRTVRVGIVAALLLTGCAAKVASKTAAAATSSTVVTTPAQLYQSLTSQPFPSSDCPPTCQ